MGWMEPGYPDRKITLFQPIFQERVDKPRNRKDNVPYTPPRSDVADEAFPWE